MKYLITALMVLGIVAEAGAQESSVKKIDSLAKTIRPQKLIFVSFRRIDVIDSLTGARSSLYHHYYFDKARRELRSVHVYENDKKHKAGRQIAYTFYDDEVIKVTFIPAAKECKQCKAEYFFSEGKLIYRTEVKVPPQNTEHYQTQARLFLAQMPRRP